MVQLYYDEFGAIELEKLDKLINVLYHSILVPAFLMGENGELLLTKGLEGSHISIDACAVRRAVRAMSSKESVGNKGQVYEVALGFGLNYYIAFLPGGSCRHILAIGPILLSEPKDALINDIIAKGKLSPKSMADIRKQLKSLPVFEHPRSYYIASLFRTLVFGELGNTEIERLDAVTFKLEELPYIDESRKYNILQTYELELEFFGYVRVGDIEEVKRLTKAFATHPFPNLCSSDQLRSMKNHAIIFCTLLTRAAIEGGVEEELAMELSDTVIQSIERIYRIDALYEYMVSVIIKFTESVLKLGAAAHSRSIKQAIRYVHRSLTEKITIKEAAAFAGFSEGHFSVVFKSETGKSFSDFVREVRVERAKQLLRHTDKPILDIAADCGFEDQSYFTKVFKKAVGMCPKEYRQV